MAIQVEESTADAEKIILTSLIMSGRYCEEVEAVLKLNYFESKYAQIIAKWCIDYFKKFNKAPKRTIQSIYIAERKNLDPAVAKIIRSFLRRLSREYSRSKSINIDYNIHFTKKFIEERSLEILFDEGNSLVEAGRHRRAKKLLDRWQSISTYTGGRINPISAEEILKYGRQSRDIELFSFDGVLGNYLGDFCKTWLVSWVAPEKRGKSWWLLEAAFQAVTKKVKVVFISLEMNEIMVKNRIYKRLTGMADEKDIRKLKARGINYLKHPVFDCLQNQQGTCLKRYASKVPLTRGTPYSPTLKYRPCDHCRIRKNYKDYKPAYWFNSIALNKIRMLSRSDVVSKAAHFSKFYGDHFRVKCYPAFSASFADVRRDLAAFRREGFDFQLVCIDYPDIMAKEDLKYIDNERASINATWQAAKSLADTESCCVMVADQGSKKSRKKRSLDKMDTTEDKRKDAHLDMKITLNQTDEEQEDGVTRLAVMYHRHDRVEPDLECMALQQLTIAQPYLDNSAELWWKKKKKEEEE